MDEHSLSQQTARDETAAGAPGGLPLRLSFVVSTSDAAPQMIRLSDEKTGFVPWTALIAMTIL
jgi:hypothetical protein